MAPREGEFRETVDQLLFGSNLVLSWDICHGTNRLPMPVAFRLKLEEGILDRWAVSEYGPAEGPRQLRAALAAWESVANGCEYSLENVLVTHGATEGLYLCFNALRARGVANVLMLGPQFPTVIATARSTGLEVAQVVGDEESCHSLPLDRAVDAIRRLRPGAACISLPMNPAGELLGDSDLSAILAALGDVGAALVVDKVCGDIASPTMQGPGSYGALANDAGVRLYMVDAYSKRRSIPGLRVGYAVASSDDIQCMSRMVVGRTVSTVPTGALLLDIEETIDWIHERGGGRSPTAYIRSIWENHQVLGANWVALGERLSPHVSFLSRMHAGINCALAVSTRKQEKPIEVFEHLLRRFEVATYPISCFLLQPTGDAAKSYQIRVTCSSPAEDFRIALEHFAEAMSHKYLS